MSSAEGPRGRLVWRFHLSFVDWLLPASLPLGAMLGALFAAIFWFHATQVDLPDITTAPATGRGSVNEALAKQLKWNSYAAVAAAVSAFCAAAITLLRALGVNILF
jgi:hypothetical protein